MEIERKIFGKSKKELEEAVKDTVKLTSKTQETFYGATNDILMKDTDEISKMLIKYYDEKQGNSDLQSELIENFASGAMEKLQERENEEKLKEIDLPEGADETVKEEALKKLEENEGKELTKDELQVEVYKAVYEKVFEEYSKLMMKLKDRQISEESLTIGDEEGTKLIIYERYLVDLEAKAEKIDSKDFDADPRISGIREEFKKDFDEKQKNVNTVTEENIDKLRELYEEKNDLSEQIQYFTLNPHLTTPSQMEALRKRYYDVAFEIRTQDPCLEEYKRQVEQVKENREFAKREGIDKNSSTDVDVAQMSQEEASNSLSDEEKKVDKKQSTIDNIEQVEKLADDEEKNKKDREEEFLKRYKMAKEKGDTLAMNALILQYREDIDVERIIDDETSRENGEVVHDEYEYESNIAGLGEINTPEEIEAAEKAADDTLEKNDKNIEEKEKEDTGIERTRTSGNWWK